MFMSGLIVPISIHWAWTGGFLQEMGYEDFAGSGVIHMPGGFAGLIGCVMVGPRYGRFTHPGGAKKRAVDLVTDSDDEEKSYNL